MTTERKKKEIVITCPHCGYEYLPAEIYYPKNFFGNPSDIDRTSEGRITVYDGHSMNLSETFTCDNCNSTFEVIADVRFKSKRKESNDFNPVYISTIYPDRISLAEDDIN